MIELAFIVPCFNESEVLIHTKTRLKDIRMDLIIGGKISEMSSIWFIDDGSSDSTWEMVESFAHEDEFIHGMKLSRNWGHQAAILAGLLNVPGEALVSMDADLQDDLTVLEKMIDEHRAGAEIVYGVKASRTTDSKFKRLTAILYYHSLHGMGVNIVYNHADFRLMSRRAIEALRDYREVNLFLRGIVPLIGFRTSEITYKIQPRQAGKSKYTISKMVTLALDGVTSFSPFPLRLITVAGFIIAILSFFIGIWSLLAKLLSNQTITGWASIVVPIYFLGGIQLISIGIIGEYISRIYLETKSRPRFIIERIL